MQIEQNSNSDFVVKGIHTRATQSKMPIRLKPAEGLNAGFRVNELVATFAKLADYTGEAVHTGRYTFDNVNLMVKNALKGTRSVWYKLSRKRRAATFTTVENWVDPVRVGVGHVQMLRYRDMRLPNNSYIHRVSEPNHIVYRVGEREWQERSEAPLNLEEAQLSYDNPNPLGIGIVHGMEIKDIELDILTQFIKTDAQIRLFEMQGYHNSGEF